MGETSTDLLAGSTENLQFNYGHSAIPFLVYDFLHQMQLDNPTVE